MDGSMSYASPAGIYRHLTGPWAESEAHAAAGDGLSGFGQEDASGGTTIPSGTIDLMEQLLASEGIAFETKAQPVLPAASSAADSLPGWGKAFVVAGVIVAGAGLAWLLVGTRPRPAYGR